MHFEFIQGGSVPPRGTPNPSSPPRERLVSLRDLANLFGCTEAEITRRATSLSISQEVLQWRGMELPSLTLSDAFKLHLAMRTAAEGSPEAAGMQAKEMEWALERKDRELEQARADKVALQQRIRKQEAVVKALTDGVNEMERAVAGNDSVHQKLVELQRTQEQTVFQKNELEFKLQRFADKQSDRSFELDSALGNLEILRQELTLARATSQEAEAATERMEFLIAQNADAMVDAEKRVEEARIALQKTQPDPVQIEHQRIARLRTSRKLRSLRNDGATSSFFERNLNRYCNRLEQRLVETASDAHPPVA